MNRMTRFGALALAALAAGACEDITNPVEEFGRLEGPYVRFEFPGAIGVPGSIIDVIFVMPTRVEEDVEVRFGFTGDAVYGTDFWALDRAGVRRTDVSAQGGTATIRYNAAQSAFPRDTLRLFVPASATDGRLAEVEITSATTASGRAIETGFTEEYRLFGLAIEGFVDIPTGAYGGQRTGQLGTATAAVTVTKPATPIEIDGTSYSFVVSDYTGDEGVFGQVIPWAFNVTSGGSVLAAPRSFGATSPVTSNVTGSFNFTTGQLVLDTTLTCCGGAGLTWRLTVTKQ